MHSHLVKYPKWKWSIYLIPRETLASFSMTIGQMQMMQNRYETVRMILITPIVAHRLHYGNGVMWLTRATHLSPPLIERMLDYLDLNQARYRQPLLDATRAGVCSDDPAVFDIPAYACGRKYAPLARFLLDDTPPRVSPGYTLPWTWPRPYSIPGYRPYDPQTRQLNE